jgi:hypothetical protein
MTDRVSGHAVFEGDGAVVGDRPAVIGALEIDGDVGALEPGGAAHAVAIATIANTIRPGNWRAIGGSSWRV